jgi:hypothetical protein
MSTTSLIPTPYAVFAVIFLGNGSKTGPFDGAGVESVV